MLPFIHPPRLSEDVIERAFADHDAIRDAWRVAESIELEALRVESSSADSGAALRALVRLLGERGLLGLVVPEAYGGTYPEVRSVALCLARERLGYTSPLVELAFAMQGLGSYAIVARGSEAQRLAVLPEIASGAKIAAFALTEPDAGSDLSRLATVARPVAGGVHLHGTKAFISNAGIADVYVVFAKVEGADPARAVTAFILDAGTPGVAVEPQQVLGGHPIGALRMDGAFVPDASRLGAVGDGLGIALEVLHRFRPTVGAAAVGFAQRALSEAVLHTRGRVQFGGPLAANPIVQLRLADMALEVESSRLLVYRAAAHADVVAKLSPTGDELRRHRERLGRMGSMAKLGATEAAQRVVDTSVQLHGGRGVERGVVARLYEDVRALRIYEGASDIQRSLIARDLLAR